MPFFFLALAGTEYGNTKVVYLSPQIAGFDFGFQWAPNTSNGYGIGNNGSGIYTRTSAPAPAPGPAAALRPRCARRCRPVQAPWTGANL